MKNTPTREVGNVEDVIPVLILNWNGEGDTVECLKSIRRSAPAGFVPVVIDNGSKPESVERLKQECNLIGENLGFARANNVGIKFAESIGAEWVMLLNNDTVVSPEAFQELRRFLGNHPSFTAITGQIRYYSPNTRIQNCGGDLTYFGSRKYRFANMDASALPKSDFSVITFLTGCALLFKYTVTGALTEDFFFGEEDYEFSLRMRQLGLEMACAHGAVVYHKVGASIARSSRPLGAILVHYASRLINTRNHYSKARWHATRILAYLYLPVLLVRNGIDPRKSISAIRRVESHLRRHHSVARNEFQSLVVCNR